MDTSDSSNLTGLTHVLTIKIEEIYIPYGAGLLKGRLFAGTPSRNKPRNTNNEAWCAEIIDKAQYLGKFILAAPQSFGCVEGNAQHDETSTSRNFPPAILIMDTPYETGYETPETSISEIVEHLKAGNDVLILSSTKKISGFVPAVLGMLSNPDCHIEKMLWPIEHAGYEMTPTQKGYIAALYDAERLRWLELDRRQEDETALTVETTADAVMLEKEIYWVRDRLGIIGRELLSEISLELMSLESFLSECAKHPALDVTLGGIASISYRLCDAFKETAALGSEAITVAKNEMPPINAGQLESRLANLRAQHGIVAERLARLYSGNLTFLSCDLNVLKGHPEISQVRGLQETILLIESQLGEIASRLGEIEVLCTQINHATANGHLPAPQKKDRDWKAMQAMLESCLQACLEKAEGAEQHAADKPAAHPKRGETGDEIIIKKPTIPSSLDSWHDECRTATFVPGGKAPKILNETPMTAWSNHPKTTKEWNSSDLLMPELKEPSLPKSSLPLASGVIAIEPDGRVWMVSPTNKFGGYENTFPKGKRDDSALTLQANAIKETYEESGLKVRITGYLGDFKRTTSITRLYLAKRLGGDPTHMGWESQAVRLVPESEWSGMLQNPSDQPVLKALQQYFSEGE